MPGLWRETRTARRVLWTVPRLRESSEGLQVHATATRRSQAGAANRRDLSRVRRADGHSPWTLRRIPRLQHVPEMSRYALDADGRQVSEGWWRHSGAPLEEARQGVLRLLELSQMRFRRVG